jgi:heterodisulfide reductase subunit A
VAKAALLEALSEVELAVQPAAVVIGGGIAGMTASLSLAHRGFPVTLVEREAHLGGILRKLHRLYPTNSPAADLVETTKARVAEQPSIEVLTSATVRKVSGYIGNYELTIDSSELGAETTVRAGVILVATGAQEHQPLGQYGYGDDPRVLTQGQMERLLLSDKPIFDSSSPTTAVMIQCVGARDKMRPYCGRICCMTAIKNAVMLKNRYPEAEVYLLYRDIEVHGVQFEDYYARAREAGVVFARYTPDTRPQVTEERVIVHDELLGAYFAIPYDLLILSTPLVPHTDSAELAQTLKVPTDGYGFFLEAHVKLRPLDFATDGIYLCGSAHWPAHLDEAISQAYGAAARAATILSKDQIRSSGATARVEEHLCRGCELCIDVCEFGAIDMIELGRRAGYGGHAIPAPSRSVAQVNQVLCKGCGACAVACPTGAMQASHFTSKQVVAMVQAALGG